MMNQDWFELKDVIKRNLSKAVWVPLRQIKSVRKDGKNGHLGYLDEFEGYGSVAVPTERRGELSDKGWNEVGINGHHKGVRYTDAYYPANVSGILDDPVAERLVLVQHFNSEEPEMWHLHQDLVLSLGLKREGNEWVRPEEGYKVVAKMETSSDGSPFSIVIRSSHLKDYLCARQMSLFITAFHERIEIVQNADHINWPDGDASEKTNVFHWMGDVQAIHEGGMPYGAKTAFFHVGRTDVDENEDVPEFDFPTDDETFSESWEKEHTGKRLYRIRGSLWINHWVEPAKTSPVVAEDEEEPTVYFIVDAEGNKENASTLDGRSRWLWFKPELVTELLSYRGSFLGWYTKNTGNISCSPDHGVHFGINSLGLINVYAKDIGLLPQWQQAIWAGFNVAPDGKVSSELLDSQMKAIPAKTQAPEYFLPIGIEQLNDLSLRKLGLEIFKSHPSTQTILGQVHRFRATTQEGLYALSKDVARILIEPINSKGLRNYLGIREDEKIGSIKLIERMLMLKVSENHARNVTAPLVAINELRQADAHLPSADINEALRLLGIDGNEPTVLQGQLLLRSCVNSIYVILQTLEVLDEVN